jgi:exopolysaccharide biosynthesis polyprenyl glycosylphosphotransferase
MSLAQRLAWLEGASTLGILCLGIAVGMPAAGGSAPLAPLALRVAIVAGVCLVSLYFHDLYDFERPHDFPELFGRVCRAFGCSALVLAVTYAAFPDTILRGNLASHALLAALVAVLFIRGTVYRLAKRPPFSERVLIMGGGPLAAALAEQIDTRPDLALRLVGFVGDPGTPLGPSSPRWRRLGDYREVGDIVRRFRPDRIVVAMPDRRGLLPVADLLACRVRGIAIEDGSAVFERFTQRLAVESLTPSALIFGDGFRVSRTQLLLKRVMSIVIAVTALVTAAPFMVVAAILIKLESPGPVFFIQERIGFRGRRFRLVKFRTMRMPADAEEDTVLRDNESRVTRFGRFLRRYRLDEIPQFLNILRGDMSVVGPRPEMAENVATFSALIPYYNLRHEVRPGLTGWAQVRAGYSMSLAEVTRKLCFDLYYIKHMSLRFDLRILFDTAKFVLSGKRPG